MRRIRYSVATSLDGFIAGPNGEYDWIVMDPDIDFNAIMQQFDTILVGRRTFEPMSQAGQTEMPGMKTYVISTRLRQSDYSNVTIVSQDVEQRIAEIRDAPGKDIWLFGGGKLFRSLLDAKLVDRVEVAVMPTLLGCGIPLMPSGKERTQLRLVNHKIYGSGTVSLEYDVI